MEKILNLNQYEAEALKTALENYIPVLDEQIKELGKANYSSSEIKKEIRRTIAKRVSLLQEILKRIKE
jgi:hypothetical protein